MESDKQNQVHSNKAFTEEVSSQNFKLTLQTTNLHNNKRKHLLSVLYRRENGAGCLQSQHGSCTAGV